MGNSNSTSSSGHHPHHQNGGGRHHAKHGGTRYPGYHPGYPNGGGGGGGYDDGWSHSLETPEQRNRMKRGYFPPRAYIGGMPPPQKVLPVANPNKLLKATSNGAILHNGGTISGRKMAELELEIRKRSTVSCPSNNNGDEMGGMISGRSTPNLLMPRMGLSSGGMGVAPSSSSSRSRDYGSEPDLRDIGRNKSGQADDQTTDDRSSSPMPNSFTLISESPAKKHIRSRKKSKAPPPPPATQMMHPHPHDFLIPYQYQLQQNPQRQLLLTPVSSGPVTPIPGNHHEEKKKSRLFKTKAESRSAMNSPAVRATPPTSNKNNTNELISRNTSHPIDPELKSGSNKMRAPNPASQFRSKSPKPEQQQQLASGGGMNQAVPKGNNNSNKNMTQQQRIDAQEKINKKTFYFGMDMGTFKQKNNNKEMMANEAKQVVSSGQIQNQAHVADLHKEISRRKMLQKLDSEIVQENGNSGQSRSSSRNSVQNNNNVNKNAKQQQNQPVNGKVGVNKPTLAKVISNGHRASESDSDGIHRRQDSGSFELNEKKVGVGVNKKAAPKIRESSSDLSSSDLDVPLVVTRPTLPQKRPELPRFSPTAAWRAIDSPSRGSNNSGRSFDLELSSGEGDSGRLHRFTRPSAPPRISAERSGDSGISAGDAGSPANAIPLLEEEDEHPRVDYDFDEEFSSSSPRMPTASKIKSNKSGSRNNMMNHRAKHDPSISNVASGADRKMKCWTPEQDLDESSSDFDQDNDPILPPVPPKPGHNNKLKTPSISSSTKFCNLFEGKRASAVVSDSDSKYFGGGGNNRAGFSSTDELNHPRRFHGRGQAPNNKEGPSSKQKRFFNSPRYRSPAAAYPAPTNHGFVGLDTNWFLSRSEPNSLNFVGIGLEESNNFNNFRKSNNFPKKTTNKKSSAPPPPPNKKKNKPVEVIVGRNNKRSTEKPYHQDLSQDELECELQLDDEFDSYSSSDPNNLKSVRTTATHAANKRNNNLTQTSSGGSGGGGVLNKKRSSEIGYGPSNMNFNNSSPSSASYEDQEEELELREEEDSEELMRDDLFDYLDQYEEGEFEREQELTTEDPFPVKATTAATDNSTLVTINHRNDNDHNIDDDDENDTSRRPFSHHIMYLPSYDARKVFHQKNAAQSWRRTRSVDALDAGEQQLFRKIPDNNKNSLDKRERIHHIEVEGGGIRDRKVSAPSYLHRRGESPQGKTNLHVSNVTITNTSSHSAMEPKYSAEEEERRAQNKKKFKFQSTLRVQERRKIEAELSREADQREEERLREIEEMKRVEEEFQKKRKAEAKARQQQQQQQQIPASKSIPPPPVIVAAKKFSVGSKNPGGDHRVNNNGMKQQQQPRLDYNQGHNRMMSQRQEPEGAPASVTVSSFCNSNNSSNSNGSTDLRKELISASKKRSGLPSQGQGQTQELSEYRQETRQYCDYRRAGRQQSLSPARFMQKSSSSSDIFPNPSRRPRGAASHSSSKFSGSGRSSSTTIAATVHPEVVCDIPVKPHPYMVNASRLNGSSSNMHLASEERPSSILGSSQNLHMSGPSSPSVHSGGDNYRRDWAHHLVTRGGPGVGGSGRASSVMSLHSAPPTTISPSDNFRNSTSDLSRLNSNVSSGYGRHRTSSTAGQGHHVISYRQYSTSPPPSESPVPSSTATDSYFHQMSENNSSRASPIRILSQKSNTTVISIGPQLMIKRPPKSNNKTSKSKNKSSQQLSPMTPTPIPSSLSPTPPNSVSFQAQPYSNNMARGYRPVAFKPPQPQPTTTAVN